MRVRLDPLSTALLAAAVAAAGCASAPVAEAPPGPPPFSSLRRVVLVRAVDRPEAQRTKDALDAIRESLEADRRTTRTIEVGRHLGPDLAGVGRLYAEVEGRIEDGMTTEWRGRRTARVGGGVRGLLDGLEADGAVLYYRFGARPLPPPPPPMSSPFSRGPGLRVARPAAALAVVDRDGNLLWFDWGGGAEDAPRDLAAASTAAEAVDALLRVIHGEDDAPGA